MTQGVFVLVTEKGLGNYAIAYFEDESSARREAALLWSCWVLFRKEGAALKELTSGGIGFAFTLDGIRNHAALTIKDTARNQDERAALEARAAAASKPEPTLERSALGSRWLGALFLFGIGIKLLLLPAYHSTDFEVHRNWMAITSQLPLSQWYNEATSEWTLDYPPFFAWFERLLAIGAARCDPGMLAISATPYASAETVAYQRSTVIAADVLLLLGSAALAAAQSPAPSRADRQLSVTLAFLNGGLLLVDHVHFQYNGMMIGLLLVSVALVATGHERSGALAFAVLLNLKHLFLFAAPLYFIHLLQGFVLRQRSPSIGALRRLVGLGVIVLATFAASLGPFVAIGQLGQLAARLFPFGRGLTHAYWAPNAWALYNVADRAGAAAVARWLPSSSLTTAIVAAKAAAGSGSTAGLVGEGSFLMLPAVGATHAAGLVLLAQLPLLLKTWRVPRPEAFAAGVACCGLAAFAFGYHVHEKAVLPPLLILSVLTPPAPSAAAALHARALLLLTSAGHYALLPLLFEPAEWSVARLLLLAHLWATAEALRQRFGNQHVGLHGLERAYLWGFVLLEAFTSAAHPLLLAPQLPFLPLLLTSVYCALGVLHATGLTYLLWWEYACGRAGGGPTLSEA